MCTLLSTIVINKMSLQMSGVVNQRCLLLTVHLAINQRRWLKLNVNQVSVALIVSADACMQDVYG